MGKKNFTDGYDPFAAQITRDAERQAALTAPEKPPPQALQAPIPTPTLVRTATAAVAPPAPRIQPPRDPAPAAIPVPKPPPRVERAAPSLGEFEPLASPRLKVSQAAFQDLENALANFHRATGSQIHYSVATRALWGLLIQAEAQIQEELRKNPLGRLPSTRDRLAYAEYEEKVRLAFGLAFRKLPRSIFQPVAVAEEAANEG